MTIQNEVYDPRVGLDLKPEGLHQVSGLTLPNLL